MNKYDIMCSRCCGVFLETNEKFDPSFVTGDMIALKKEHSKLEINGLLCPSCGNELTGTNGRFKRIECLGVIADTVPMEDNQDITSEITQEAEIKEYSSKELANLLGCSESSIRGKREQLKNFMRKEGRKNIYSQEAFDYLSGD